MLSFCSLATDRDRIAGGKGFAERFIQQRIEVGLPSDIVLVIGAAIRVRHQVIAQHDGAVVLDVAR